MLGRRETPPAEPAVPVVRQVRIFKVHAHIDGIRTYQSLQVGIVNAQLSVKHWFFLTNG